MLEIAPDSLSVSRAVGAAGETSTEILELDVSCSSNLQVSLCAVAWHDYLG